MRLYLGLGMRKTASFVNSLIPAVLKPGDIIKMNQLKYSQAVSTWSGEAIVNRKLSEAEEGLLNKAELKPGSRILVLFAGGGRETVALAKLGYQVVGVDIVPEMVERARQSARHLQVKADFHVQDASRLDFPPESFDAVAVFAHMYGSIPTIKRRVETLKRIHHVLKAGGVLLFNFAHDKDDIRAAYQKRFWLRKTVAYATLGNFGYQVGDRLYAEAEFLHYFSKEEIMDEAKQGGFEIAGLSVEGYSGWAVLRKKAK